MAHSGKLIYNLYGEKTENSFVKSWGTGLAIEQVESFQELLQESAKALLVLVLLDLFITGPARWFEQVRSMFKVLTADHWRPDSRLNN